MELKINLLMEGKMTLEEMFEKYDDEYLNFERVDEPLHSRPDICAFILLDRLLPNPGRDIVDAAEHDEIFLDVDIDKLEGVATEADILTLVRCGVRYGEYGLCMFV